MSSTGRVTKRRATKLSGTDSITKTAVTETRGGRTLRPSNMAEVSALSELLAPTRRAFVKLCGQLPPPASMWDSYNRQFRVLRKAFRTNWSRLYQNVDSPDLPYAAEWSGSILSIYQPQQHSSTLLRAFDASESAKLDEAVKRLRDTHQGPFSKGSKREVLPDPISRRIVNANKFCLNQRTSLFERRPTFKGVHESQKWCLRRLHSIWKLKSQGVDRVIPTTNGVQIPSDGEQKFGVIVISIVERYLDDYRDWLATDGHQIWQAGYKDMITGRAFTKWLAPRLYVASRHGKLVREENRVWNTGSGGNGSFMVTKYGQHSQAFEQVQDSLFAREINGSNVFMGSSGNLLESHEALQLLSKRRVLKIDYAIDVLAAAAQNMADLQNFPTSASELIFPSNSLKLSVALGGLHHSSLSIHHRLRSILHDSEFAQLVASDFELPLVANERCGTWYIPPGFKAGSVYFKSTDGHTNQWSFSLRRLNLHLLDVIAQEGGCIIVDSTRKGKSMPDALSKTVPIWCAVLNSLLFGSNKVFLPQEVVGPSERAQIQQRVDGWTRDAKALNLDVQYLRSKITKPLRPLWKTPDSSNQPEPTRTDAYFPVICCTVSRHVQSSELSTDGYVQGAADDSESWALGITPWMLWEHKEALMNTYEADLTEVIQDLKHMEPATIIRRATLVRPTETTFIGTLAAIDPSSFDGIVICSQHDDVRASSSLKDSEPHKVLELSCGKGKLGSRALRNQLQHVPTFIERLSSRVKNPKLLFACSTGQDLSAGVALAVLCLYFNEECLFQIDLPTTRVTRLNKELIRQRLAWITTSEASINPSRATLQAVNGFLIPRL